MNREQLILKLRESFGEALPLPVAIIYSDRPLGETPERTHCMIRHMVAARDGQAVTLADTDIYCRGGKVYTGYADMNEKICKFVSEIEKYKSSPEAVAEYAAGLALPKKYGKYLNFVRIDNPVVDLDKAEGLVFFVNPDMLAGLWSWANFDINKDDSIIANFGSGCATTVSNLVRENEIDGYRCFIGMLDISVRPLVRPNELTFSVPRSRLKEMLHTIDQSCLSGAPAWLKVKARLNNPR